MRSAPDSERIPGPLAPVVGGGLVAKASGRPTGLSLEPEADGGRGRDRDRAVGPVNARDRREDSVAHRFQDRLSRIRCHRGQPPPEGLAIGTSALPASRNACASPAAPGFVAVRPYRPGIPTTQRLVLPASGQPEPPLARNACYRPPAATTAASASVKPAGRSTCSLRSRSSAPPSGRSETSRRSRTSSATRRRAAVSMRSSVSCRSRSDPPPLINRPRSQQHAGPSSTATRDRGYPTSPESKIPPPGQRPASSVRNRG